MLSKNKIFDILFLLIFIVFIALVVVNIGKPAKNEVCFDKECIEVELAATYEEQLKGLSNRTSLDEGSGMLFVFKRRDSYPFWMKGMLFPLDIVWIDESGVVVDLFENAIPCNGPVCIAIYPEASAKYVLELNAGTIKRIGFGVGDKLEIRLKDV